MAEESNAATKFLKFAQGDEISNVKLVDTLDIIDDRDANATRFVFEMSSLTGLVAKFLGAGRTTKIRLGGDYFFEVLSTSG